MSHFNFESQLNDILKMDAPLRGVPVRLPKRSNMSTCDDSQNASQMNISQANCSQLAAKTPPRKTTGKGAATPKSSKKSPRVKTPGCSDRFIANRGAMNQDMSKTVFTGLVTAPSDKENSEGDYAKAIKENLRAGADYKVLALHSKAPQAPEGHLNGMKVVYSGPIKTPMSTQKSNRYLPTMPERILDAPDLRNDFYLNLLDWSDSNLLAVALGASVFIWNASTGNIRHLFEMEGSNDYITSVKWSKGGGYLAVGTSLAQVLLYDVEANKRLRTMASHSSRVPSISWHEHLLSSGDRAGEVHNSDVRVASHHICTLQAHQQEVCGLGWSFDGKFLASGGNDNMVNVWTYQQACSSGEPVTEPLHQLTQHQGGVKAVGWCPWQTSLLASGGGTSDRAIKIWNASSGALLSSVDAMSQVSGIIWSPHYRELVSAHGFSQNQLILWKYPQMNKLHECVGHKSRILQIALSPDGQTVVSAGGDETLRMWTLFQVDPAEKAKSEAHTTIKSIHDMRLR